MKDTENRTWYVVRRGELLAHQFLDQLQVCHLCPLSGPDIGLDYIAFFETDDHFPRAIAIELKATQREVKGRYEFPAKALNRLRHANIPILIVVVDVKNNEIYFTWAKDALDKNAPKKALSTRTIVLRKSTGEENNKLRTEILAFKSTS